MKALEQYAPTAAIFGAYPVDFFNSSGFFGGGDKISGSLYSDTLRGWNGADSINGASGDDFLEGGWDNDTLFGGEGNDTINGGGNNDSIDGGAGNDLIIWDAGAGVDTIDGGDGIDVIAISSSSPKFDFSGGSIKLIYGGSYSMIKNVEYVKFGSSAYIVLNDRVKSDYEPVFISENKGVLNEYIFVHDKISAGIAVYTASAFDMDAIEPLVYSVFGGADSSFFNINPMTGALSFKVTPNFQFPSDFGGDNVYEVVLSASDGALFGKLSLSISLADLIKFVPYFVSEGGVEVLENVSATAVVYTANATESDANATLTYSISGGADAALFDINASTGAVTFKTSPNFEAPLDSGANNVYDITVRASDGTLYAEKAVAITVTDVNEVPSSVSLQGMTYFWKANASGQHALLSDVTVSAAGGAQPAEGTAPSIQLKNIVWNSSGHATADIYAHVTSAVGNIDLNLNLGGATGASFTSALPSDWIFQNSQTSNGYFISGASINAIGSGDVKVGSISFETGLISQIQLGFNSGTKLGSASVSPYGFTLSHDTTGSPGAFSITPIDAGSYALTASRGISDIGAAINSADALAALKIAVSMNPNATTNGTQLPVSPFQIMAADINGDGRVNSADALAILKVAVHLSTAITPQWVFVEDTHDFYDDATGLFTLTKSTASWDHNINATVSGSTTENLVGVLMGDVNGSWTPPAGSQYVETLNPTYFTDLANRIHTPVSEWGVL